MAGFDRYWGMTVVTLILNLASLIWASYLASKASDYYSFSPLDPDYNDYITTEDVNSVITYAIVYPLIVAALLNVLGSGFVFHGLHRKNNCSLIWYIVLNSIAMSDQIVFGFSGLVLGYSSWSTYDYYSGNVITIDSSSMNPRSLGYFMVPLIVISMVTTVMIGQRRKQIRNEMIAQRMAANQPQVIMVPGATTITTQQMQPQFQQGQQYQMQYQQGQQYPMQYQQGQQYPMPQQNQQQGNLPPLYATAPGTNQQYGTSNPAYAETEPVGY